MRSSLKTKTIIGVALIEVVLLAILIVSAISFLTDIIDETLTKRAETTAALFAVTTKGPLLAYDLASLEAFSEALIKQSDITYIKIIGQNEKVFVYHGKSAEAVVFKQDHQLSDVTDGIFDTVAYITEGGVVFGRIELGISIQPTLTKIAGVQIWSGSLALLELLLVASFSYILGSYLTRQLKTLNVGSRKVKKALKTRKFEGVEIIVKGNDELSDLAISFNSLSESLQHELLNTQAQQDELQVLNNELESKVVKRTEMLELKNQELLAINNKMKETQHQLLQAEKMASVGQLAAGVAHEINNPIGFVSNNLLILKDYASSYKLLSYEVSQLVKADDSEKCKAFLRLKEYVNKEDFDYINDDVSDLVNESAEGLHRITEIVTGLRQFSRIDDDKTQLFDVNTCLKTTLNMVNNELKYNCTIETDFISMPKIAINVGKINQVFTNIIVNASHALAATGKPGLISLSTRLENNYIVIKIRDTGIGMPNETLKSIFNPFFTTKPEGSGTGLGLSISFGIIKDHNGEISVESKLGSGTCFTVKLPITNS